MLFRLTECDVSGRERTIVLTRDRRLKTVRPELE
jgi:hypothetical protein